MVNADDSDLIVKKLQMKEVKTSSPTFFSKYTNGQRSGVMGWKNDDAQ